VWRTWLVNPALIAVTVTAAVACCRLGGIDPHGREAATAAGIAVAASMAAGVVLTLGRLQPPTPAGPTVSALLAMVTHLGVTLLLSLVVVMTAGVATVPFAYWMLGLFWATLLGLAGVCVRTVRGPAAGPRTAG
jgi:hypothetical protein